MRLSQTLLLERPMALYQLRRNIGSEVKQTAITYKKERRATNAKYGKFREFSFETGEEGYNTRVRVYGQQSSRSPAWVHCTCPNFRYVWDWVLTQRETSDLYRTRNKPPDVRNPQRKRGVCKHVAAALEWLKKERGL